jgi:hypothetical protein
MKKIATIALLALSLTACAAEDPCIKADNPVECRQWTQAGGDPNDYLLYGMVGYMIGSSNGNTYIYRDPGYRGTYHPNMTNRYGSQQAEIKRLKVERQRAELRRQQQIKRQQSTRPSTYKPSTYRPSPSKPSGKK